MKYWPEACTPDTSEAESQLKIVIDGLKEEVPDNATVQDIMQTRGEPTTHVVVVELNGVFVHPDRYKDTRLDPGDRLEVVYPAFGG